MDQKTHNRFFRCPGFIIVSLLFFSSLLFAEVSSAENKTIGNGPKRTNFFSVRFFAAGHGDSALLTTPEGHNILVDSGMADPKRGDDLLTRRLFPYFKKKGTKRLDAFILSHPHSDHIGNPRRLFRRVPFAALYTNGDGAHFFRSRRMSFRNRDGSFVRPTILKRGDILRFGGAKIEVLHPRKKNYLTKRGRSIGAINNRSLVIMVRYGDVSFLLPGDLSRTGERALVKTNLLKSVDVLKLGHHGQGSGSEEWINRLRPRYAVIPCCDHPWYEKVPRPVMNRLRRYNIRVFRTDRHKDVIFRTDGKTLTFHTEMNFRMLPAGHCIWAMKRGLIDKYSCRVSRKKRRFPQPDD